MSNLAEAVCEGDLLPGMVFDAGRPPVGHQASASLPTPVGAVIPYMHQDSLERAFQSFPPCLLQGFRFPLIEDLVN